ncbi:unnamed protein product [Pleuronectes platessa]|uniref:Uncharacterized protein n=1 Tax=Pleuronectes platessa TaxID=8262 RepID=A0A9N7UDD6_PLEPL|nr:unnamed protein product [Pleuronectes platessa]
MANPNTGNQWTLQEVKSSAGLLPPVSQLLRLLAVASYLAYRNNILPEKQLVSFYHGSIGSVLHLCGHHWMLSSVQDRGGSPAAHCPLWSLIQVFLFFYLHLNLYLWHGLHLFLSLLLLLRGFPLSPSLFFISDFFHFG